MKNDQKIDSIGRAKAIFVFGQGASANAILSIVSAKISPLSDQRVRYAGPVAITKKTAAHIENTVIPLIDSILDYLSVPRASYEISILNPGAASILSVGSKVSGFSLDVSIFLSIISVTLGLSIPQDLVSTGHIASADGDIRMVKSLGAKIAACVEDDLTKGIVYPEFENDISIKALCPSERNQVSDAIARAKGRIRLIAIQDVAELVSMVFSEEELVLASLRNCYFGSQSKETDKSSVGSIFKKDNLDRFWRVLEEHLLCGRSEKAKKMLSAYCEFHTQEKKYPAGLGNGLTHLIYSLPPISRYKDTLFPLISVPEAIKISQFAGNGDYEDVSTLFAVISGDGFQQANCSPLEKQYDQIELSGEDLIQHIVNGINEQALFRTISQPLDTARATYSLKTITVENEEQLYRIISAYYIHMMRHFHGVTGPIKHDFAAAEAFVLLDRAFSDRGGYKAALAEAKNGINGGIRLILDKITDRFKWEQQEMYIGYFLKSIMNPLDWDEKANLIQSLFKALENFLPAEITSQPPEKFANDFESIVKAYVKSMNSFNTVLNSYA